MKPAQSEWNVVYTNARQEATAAHWLKRSGYEVLFLKYKTRVRHARRVEDAIRPYFPRYVFMAAQASQGLASAFSAPGVSTVLYCGDKPLAVPQPVIDELSGRADSDGLIREATGIQRNQRVRLRQGQEVRVDHGPFEGFIGMVELDRGVEVRVWLRDLFRGLTVHLPPEALSPYRAERA